ncbi:MAG: DUF2484 family protein [Rhodobacteraceae bacterium]|nr:DUF2484 family protein [Paracoccaceae bacterium]
MNASLLAAAFWVLAATFVAMLPMRRQYAPGMALLVAAPVLIVWLGHDFGWFWSLAGVLAFVSMFRNPLRHVLRRAGGREVRK